jgi:hypothetical protein
VWDRVRVRVGARVRVRVGARVRVRVRVRVRARVRFRVSWPLVSSSAPERFTRSEPARSTRLSLPG